ncbi:MAG: hypothetical protein ABII93_07795 [Chrysiogenia bacterium]
MREIEKIIDVILNGNKVTYISAPISSGKRFLQWYKTEGIKLNSESDEYNKSLFLKVIKKNNHDSEKKISKINKIENNLIVDPTKLDFSEWTQNDYRIFWSNFIKKHVSKIIMLNDWEYSIGCVTEFKTGILNNIDIFNENNKLIEKEEGLKRIKIAFDDLNINGCDTRFHEEMLANFSKRNNFIKKHPENKLVLSFFKDEILDRLSKYGNVAQFISFDSSNKLSQRFSRIFGMETNQSFNSLKTAVKKILAASKENSVNIRSYFPNSPKGEPLIYGLIHLDEIISKLKEKASENKFTILNETINISDGGVSGVLLGNIIEFSPFATPQCVDQPGICSLPRELGMQLLKTVYGFYPDLFFNDKLRVEFSLHPIKRGYKNSHTILWEIEKVESKKTIANISWPNNFSKMLGDKVFGLLIADALGFNVPFTLVINRKIAPFSFGRHTGTHETWIRSCPTIRTPGKYPTFYGWVDPFIMTENIEKELNENSKPNISSIIAQDSVNSFFSGSLITLKNKKPFIEGVQGRGDDFMVGKTAPQNLPSSIKKAVSSVFFQLKKKIGPIEMEWVYDGKKVWIVQLHQSKSSFSSNIIYPGKAKKYIKFEVLNTSLSKKDKLEELRSLVSKIKGKEIGITFEGDIGITSHFGDILRENKIISKIIKAKKKQPDSKNGKH